ncbi:MAG: 3-phosphoshikimate 1-carboxyvinyltransferase [Clostridia bacterium]|nr:3-phosphoshikimate 1-carboxyvinyltransferase [Clostridia bacterium]
MKAIIQPSPLCGEVNAPASKSVAHRALICAALSDKPTEVICSTTSADIDATAECLRRLSAKIERTATGFFVEPIADSTENAELNCGESGSTLRFMLPVAASLGKAVLLYGSGRLPERPIGELCNALCSHGCRTSGDNIPLTVSGRLEAGDYIIDGSVSSQFISGLLLALPQTHAESTVTVIGEIQSKPYIDMTLSVLSDFGIKTEFVGNKIKIFQNNGFISPEKYTVEGDWSNGAFFICADAIDGNNVKCLNLTDKSIQGDKAVAEIAQKYGSDTRIDVGNIPDLVPVLAVTACFFKATTVFYNAARLKIKESDRLLSTKEMINNLGGRAETTDDTLTVYGTGELNGGTVESFNDHRIVMAAAIAASRCKSETAINGCEAVNKSYPTFFEEFQALGGKVNLV